PQHRHGDAAAEIGPRLEVELAEHARAEDRIGNDAAARLEGPAAVAEQPMDDRERDHALESLELAEDQGAVRPRAGERDDEVVAVGFGLEAADAARPRFAARRHPVAERRVRPDEMTRPVVRKVTLRAPGAFEKNAHVRMPVSCDAIGVLGLGLY